MNRKEFLQTLLASGVGLAMTLGPQKLRAKGRYLYSGTVAGTYYYEFENCQQHIGQNDAAVVQLEPSNPHDHRAIEVFWKGRKMGYIPRADNKTLYNMMKDGAQLSATIRVQVTENKFDPKDPYCVLRIRVYEG